MLHSGGPTTPEGHRDDQEPQDSGPYAPFHNLNFNHSFDNHSLGRLDAPITPSLFNNQPTGTENHALPSTHNSFAGPSMKADPLVLDDILAPPRHNDFTHTTSVSESHEMNQFNTPSKPAELHRDALPSEMTPYLGLRARLTQIPMNRWTVLLLLVLARLIILFQSLNTNLADAQQEASSACAKVEEMGSAMVSMPHYMSAGGK